VRRVLHFHEPGEPLAGPFLGAVRALVDGLVLPMRGDAALGDLVHLVRAYLYLERHAVRTEQRRMQGLVAVDPRDRNVVLEAPRHRLVELMREPEDAVAAVNVGDDDTDAEDIHDLGEVHVLAKHLLVDAVQVLLSPGHARLDAVRLELVDETALDAAQRLTLIAPC